MLNLTEIAYDIAKARILLEKGDVEGVALLLDDAAKRIPEIHWPSGEELEAAEEPQTASVEGPETPEAT